MQRNINFYRIRRAALCWFFLFIYAFINAQQKPAVKDSTRTSFSFLPMELPDPDSIESKYEYDPKTNRYKYSQSIDGYDIRFPLYLSPDEYFALIQKEQIRSYFKEKENALNGKGADAEEKRKRLLPIFYVNSSFFESVFGSNEIEIIPQGSVEVDLGMLYNKQDNPSFSPRNQRNFTFDFDQRISMSLQGNIGTRLSVLANFDTESTFDFQNQFKLQYNPHEDNIIQAIEVGNINMPLNTSLIQGAQSLFGVKAQLQFGKTTITGVFSEQRSDTRTVSVQGGGTVEDFELFALDYDDNRHFFLSHYFRDTYDKSLERYPFINSNIQITRIQVWVTNRTNNTRGLSNSRNLVGIQDLGESEAENIGYMLTDGKRNANPSIIRNTQPLPNNANNRFDPSLIGKGGLTQQIRDIAFVQEGFGSFSDVSEGLDFSILENARLLTENQYDLNPQLGYISLNQRLNNDEILAVAFQYTKNGQVYQVGEFANDGVANTVDSLGGNSTPNDSDGDGIPNDQDNDDDNDGTLDVNDTVDNNLLAPTQNLIVKTLKSSVISVSEPVWDLMMKNIYNLGAFQLDKEDFRLNIFYTDPSPVNFITDTADGTTPLPIPDNPGDRPSTLLRLFRLDNLNLNNDPVNGGDGFFDFFPGLTIDQQNGRMIFTTAEPFGEHLFNRLAGNTNAAYEPRDEVSRTNWNANQQQYVFDKLYTTTKIEAEQQQADKNKFQIKGRYKTSGQNGISIGAFNVPRGSVRVTAGGRLLQEGVDYTVNYQLGRVQIIDPALQNSNTPIEISTENNAVFGQQTKRFMGLNVEHKISKDFVLGATYLNLRERPLTQKSNLDFEPINNKILGFNANYSTEVPFLTRMVNKLPNIDTEAPSNLSVRGEFAYLFADAPNAADFNGEVTSYIDDFEGAQSRIDISSPLQWELSSVPKGFDNGGTSDDVSTGFKRAALSWYAIDQIFYSRQRPSGVTDFDVSRPETRRVFFNEIFPNRQIAQNQTQALFTLDLHYRPEERGPYNYNTSFDNSNKSENFGGIIRALNTTNFEQSNIEFIEFWLLNPYANGQSTGYMEDNEVGEIRFNIGNISEDVLKDNRKQYENGLPESINDDVGTTLTEFSRAPSNQSLVYTFDSDGAARLQQDVGLDGYNNDREKQAFPDFATEDDTSKDDYEYFLQSAEQDIEKKYSKYNGLEGNSPTEVSNTNRGRVGTPSIEDVNRDNTMNRIDQYYEYKIEIEPGKLTTDNPLVATVIDAGTREVPDGGSVSAQWIQFKIPLNGLKLANGEDIRTSFGATDLRSSRFLRMYLTGFQSEALLRFGALDLVRGNYRTYIGKSEEPDSREGRINFSAPEGNVTDISVSSVSVEETDGYVTPPGVVREQLNNNNTIIAQDERSLSITVENIEKDDARAAYKNFNIDMRQYENLELFIHAQETPGEPLEDGDLSAIVRLGNDFTDNYYQIELPLEKSDLGNENPDAVWPSANRMRVPLKLLQKVKANIIGSNSPRTKLAFFDSNGNPSPQASGDLGQIRVGIKGNPSFGNVRVLMLGVKNTKNSGEASGQVWFNEMRLSGLKNQGGWAAVASLDANVADFANFTATGRTNTIGFGGIEQGPNERSQEDLKQYDFTTSVNVGQLLPKKWGIKVPVTYSRGEELITPQYDPFNQDLILKDVLNASQDKQTRDAIEEQSEDYTLRQSVSVIGLRKERTGDKKPMPYDVENLSFSSTYNQTDHRDFEIKESIDQRFNVNGTYSYAFAPMEVSPLKKLKFFENKKYLNFLKDINFNPMPSNVNITSGINRTFNEQEFRDVTLGANDIGIEPLQQRNYLFDWQYNLGFNLTKSFNFNFSSNSNRIVRNYINDEDIVDRSITIWDGLGDLGQPNLLNQTLQANYELPFSKFPGLQFIKSSYSYTSDFQWQKGSEIFRDLEITNDNGEQELVPDLGNSIQNSGVHRINSTFELSKLYKSIGFVKRTSNSKKKKKKKIKGEDAKDGQPKIAPRTRTAKKKTSVSKNLKPSIKAYNALVTVLSSVKRINLNYQRDSGTVLPGYTNDVGFLGTLDPSPGFIFGSQNDIRQRAAQMGYLTLYQEFNDQYQNRKSEQIDFRATVDLLKGLKIDVTANRAKADTYSENFRIEDQTNDYISLTPNSFGNFSISSLPIRTAFQSSSESSSKAFEDFKENRRVIANRLAGPNAEIDPTTGFPEGYGPNNQAVLLPAFLAAYNGQNASKVSKSAFRDLPLPNWNIRYTGLQKIKWFKKRFKRFSLSHAYQSRYTINQYQTNLEYEASNPDKRDIANNFINETLFGSINLTEQFSPLLKIDMETQSSIKVSTELRRDRALSFSFDNNLLTEVQGNEYIIGLGYRIKDITFTSRLGTGKKRVIKSDLNLKADLSLRQNETIIRNLDVDNNQVTAGQSIYSIRFTSDYALSKNLTALFFYDHTFSKFAVSTAFPQTNIRSGFTLRYNFGN